METATMYLDLTSRAVGHHWQRLFSCGFLLGAILLLPVPVSAAQPNPSDRPALAPKQAQPICPQPALARVTRHRIAPGETLIAIAQRYNLIPATLMGFNPVLRNGAVPVGTEISVPPYNGIRVEVPAGRTWRDVAATYRVRADVLFEINGCQPAPRIVFVPGVNWSPDQTAAQSQSNSVLKGYPLPSRASILLGYGWQVYPSGQVGFNSGVDLAAAQETPVLTVGAGTIAFAAEQGDYGNLVVINHDQGLQTRYAHLDSIAVRVGQVVSAGDRLGTVGTTGRVDRPMLHFEVRTNSSLGWVAQDPSDYIDDVSIAEQ
jgi:murein DD-endopeptidase MepM/ murein hydrolase activator NlpD